MKTLITLTCLLTAPLLADVRLKDIASVEGVRPNYLNGFGLVVGLNGTGDKDQTRFTTQALVNALAKSGISLDPTTVKVKNVAFVLVQAELPAFSRPGTRVDVTVSSYGDATSLQGGTLLWSELKGLDNQTYAICQGPVIVGGFAAGNSGSNVTQNHPTVGRIPNGGLIERPLPVSFSFRERVRFILDDADFVTMERTVQAINAKLGTPLARSLDPRTLEVIVPLEQQNDPVGFVSMLEHVNIAPDSPARVVINEKTGTIIMGRDVRIDQVAISHGGLTVIVQSDRSVVQPNPLSRGETAVQENFNAEVQQNPGSLMVAREGVSLGAIADTLNALKVTPRDMIAILQAMKEAGALHAELVVM
ncbi:MAG: flagellar basal body P-ring protein FlgI [Acidobacteria bacterium]|nr:flagellar basal body P-ring protein FlgI [Acidobacteriota bacterium]MCB9396226.1 flagellar basal body P-ring protein FlgI [Acidobacteriota bacterium]